MATLEDTPLPILFSLSTGEALQERADVFVHKIRSSDKYEPRVLEAGWDDDAKVAANFDIYEGIAELGGVRRPSHWGEDSRALGEQLPEYRIGLDAMVRHILDMRIKALDIGPVQGLAAEAMMEVQTPDGWLRRSRLEGWLEGDTVDIREAVAGGESISFRYTRNQERQTPDNVYYLPGVVPEHPPAA